MENQLLQEIEYKIEKTSLGTWRRYGYINGTSYHEFTSHKSICSMPLLHYTYGRNPETGRRVIAKGIFAVGRIAYGVVAIGQASFGLVAIGQLAIGIIIGLGQLSTGLMAIGQAAIAIYIGIGQVAVGKYVLAQIGFGKFVYSMKRADPQAAEFFKSLPIIRDFFP